jgi:hypothetical protein
MIDAPTLLTAASAGTVGLAIVSLTLLRGWNGWLELKRLELQGPARDLDAPMPSGSRIEVADLKERIRKLEAIANGADIQP